MKERGVKYDSEVSGLVRIGFVFYQEREREMVGGVQLVQPKCPLTEEWIKKVWYIYTMEYCSAITKNEIMPFAATWMDLEMIILSEGSQTEKDKYHIISLICGI